MFKRIFSEKGAFKALNAAQDWLTDNGYSYGPTCVMHPAPVLKGDFIIAKWRNLTKKEIKALDGWFDGDLREGPVTVMLKVAPDHFTTSASTATSISEMAIGTCSAS
ncbi:MAG: hypothetical protein ACRER8_12010 [Pseudomonas sp.]|uniref:hypothetical protein n=1 Tax=Pseudomonas sp. TaxID=306 RepID=UPI003D6E5B0E